MEHHEHFRNASFSEVPHEMQRIFRPLPCFTNLGYDTEILFEQEIDLLLDIALMTLSCLPYVPVKGTLILDGKKRDENAQCILRANLSSGNSASDTRAEEAIDGVLTNIKLHDDNGQIQHFNDGLHPPVLILGTTYGHFLATINCADVLRDHEEIVLLALATTLAQMGKEDQVLQKNFTHLRASYLKNDTHQLYQRLFSEFERLFKASTHQIIETWRKWHEPANNSGQLKLFFE